MKKEELPEAVLKAYAKYEQAQDEESAIHHSNEVEYKKAHAKANRRYKAFEKECEKAGLDHWEVNKLFIPTTIKLHAPQWKSNS